MDGVGTAEEYASRAKEIGMTSLACTDHGTLTCHRRFHDACLSHGIKPILGIEAYITEDRFDRRDNSERKTPLDLVYNHIILLAKNQIGLKNLGKLNEVAWNEGFYKKPRIDFDVLNTFKEGIIVSTACASGLINKAIELDEIAVAKKRVEWFASRFGDDFYMEVMPHNSLEMNMAIIDLADCLGVKVVVTPDCHHCTKDQKVIQEIMLILNTHAKLNKDVTYDKSTKIDGAMSRLDYLYGKDRQMSFNSFDIHLLSQDEMYESMRSQDIYREDIYDNTNLIAECVEEYTINRNLNLLPVRTDDPNKDLVEKARAGLRKRNLENNSEYRDRLEFELKVISDKNLSSYFLVVSDMINWAKSQDILVGPGRGSSAGSLVCYALGITEIDPIEYNLLFFRFINPERNDIADIDTDIQDNRRDEIKQYLEERYVNVASIATFLEFKDKGLIRDVARVFHIPLSDVNKVLKVCDTFEEFCMSNNTQWFRNKYPEVEEYADKLRGRIRGTGVHAAGVVTSSQPISLYAPMETRSIAGASERIPVVSMDMEEVADLGLVKIDALGLKTLTVISDTLVSIKSRHNINVDLNSIDLEDKHVYQMLSDGLTKGVFQCSATPYTKLLVKMGVSSFKELVASNALVRPGAMNTIGKEYIARKNGQSTITYLHPIMKEYTDDTYGCILYQEQVMLTCTKIGGMSMSDADKVRKIIGKKKDAQEFDQFKDQFINNSVQYIQRPIAERIWHDFEAHANYSFNKAHAVAYSKLSYWTAWLKYYYPVEYMYALLKNESDKDSRTEYLIECKRMKIPLRLPHINESDIDFKIEGQSIRMGLSSIKYISNGVATKICNMRPFKSYANCREKMLVKKSGINIRSFNAMDNIGALTFDDNPRDNDRIKQNMYEYLNITEFRSIIPIEFAPFKSTSDDYDENGAHILSGVVKKIKRSSTWSRIEFMDALGVVGAFDSESSKIEDGRHYIFAIADNNITEAIPVDEFEKHKENPLMIYLAFRNLPCKDDESYVVAFKTKMTKKGQRMATMMVSDSRKNITSVIIFPSMFSEAYMKCEPGNSIVMNTIEREGNKVLREVVSWRK